MYLFESNHLKAGWNPELQIEALEKGVGVTSEAGPFGAFLKAGGVGFRV